MYAIKLLEKSIYEHQSQIKKLENIEYELSFDEFFSQEEIKERTEYISQLQNAVTHLLKQKP